MYRFILNGLYIKFGKQKQPPEVFYKKSGLQLYLKKALAQVFSCEFCEISKNTNFSEQLLATASRKQKKVRQPTRKHETVCLISLSSTCRFVNTSTRWHASHNYYIKFARHTVFTHLFEWQYFNRTSVILHISSWTNNKQNP